MNKQFFITSISTLTVLFLLLPHGVIFGKTVPHSIAGFELGSDVADYPHIEYSNFLKEVVVMDWHGFRKGVISYGICQSPGTIVKIKMKYENSTKKFFNTLLKKYKADFGPPNEWKGDSFGIKHIWKWRFTDKEGNIVSLLLQHNLQDPNDNIGNMVKLSYPEKIEDERLCFIQVCEANEDPEKKKIRDKVKKTDWKYLIPK